MTSTTQQTAHVRYNCNKLRVFIIVEGIVSTDRNGIRKWQQVRYQICFSEVCGACATDIKAELIFLT
jgi:hypothetical protein